MDQPLRAKTFTLASATLSGGMRSASATGTRPARLVEALDKHFASIVGSASAGGIALDPDGLHFWYSDVTNNRIRKMRISDGSVITTFTSNASDGGTRNIATPRGLTRRGNFIYCANAGTNNWIIEIDTVNSICRIYSNAVIAAPSHVVSAVSGKAWIRSGIGSSSGTYTEVSFAGTGDSAAVTATGKTEASGFDCVASEAGDYLFFALSTTLKRRKLSDDSTTTFTPIVAQSGGLPNYTGILRELGFDRFTGNPIINVESAGVATQWYRVLTDMTGYDALAFGQVMYAAPPGAFGGVPTRAPFDILADGSCMVGWASAATGNDPNGNVHARYVNLGLQRARWSWTPGVAIKILRLAVPGYFGNLLGDIESMPNPAFLTSEHNHKRVRCYYSLDGGSTRYELDSGADNTLLSGDGRPLTMTASQTITIDADIQRSPYMPFGPRPFIGGPSGEGPTLLYSKPDPSMRVIGAGAL